MLIRCQDQNIALVLSHIVSCILGHAFEIVSHNLGLREGTHLKLAHHAFDHYIFHRLTNLVSRGMVQHDAFIIHYVYITGFRTLDRHLGIQIPQRRRREGLLVTLQCNVTIQQLSVGNRHIVHVELRIVSHLSRHERYIGKHLHQPGQQNAQPDAQHYLQDDGVHQPYLLFLLIVHKTLSLVIIFPVISPFDIYLFYRKFFQQN